MLIKKKNVQMKKLSKKLIQEGGMDIRREKDEGKVKEKMEKTLEGRH